MINSTCFECNRLLVTQTDEPINYDLTKFKRPDIINKFKSTYSCKDNVDSSGYMVCPSFEQKDWENALDMWKKKMEEKRLSDNNFNNVSNELLELTGGETNVVQ